MRYYSNGGFMKKLSSLLIAIALFTTACDKDKNIERTGIEDHPKGNTNVSGMDASGPASGARTNK
jgi:hypothetical protein